jgi:hypothetical protein
MLSSAAFAADVMSRFGEESYSLALKTNTEAQNGRSFLWIAASETAGQPGPLLNFSYIAPGVGPDGGLTVDGDYTQNAGATLAVDLLAAIPGAHDTLFVSGAATLDGVVEISLADGFTPKPGDLFTIIKAGQVKDLGLSLAGEDHNFRLVSTLDEVVLVYDALPGDYNLDGTVDAADYVVWRDALGQSGSSLAADGTGPDLAGAPDGIVNHHDYLYWKAHYGADIASATTTVVPEPSGWIAAIVALCACSMGRPLHVLPSKGLRGVNVC